MGFTGGGRIGNGISGDEVLVKEKGSTVLVSSN